MEHREVNTVNGYKFYLSLCNGVCCMIIIDRWTAQVWVHYCSRFVDALRVIDNLV